MRTRWLPAGILFDHLQDTTIYFSLNAFFYIQTSLTSYPKVHNYFLVALLNKPIAAT